MVFEDVMPSRVENNEMTNARDGLVLLNNGQIGPQGASGRPSDNGWGGSYQRSGIFTDLSPGNLSPFFVRPGKKSTPTTATNSVPIALIPTNGPHISCPQPEDPVVGPLTAIATGDDSSFAVFPEETRWLAGFLAFEAILKDTTGHLHVEHRSFCDSISLTNVGKVCRINKLLRESAIAAAIAENGSLNPSCTIEQNHRSFNEMFFEYLGNSLAESRLADLHAIAAQCPLKGGFAVYQARTLLNAITDRVNIFEDDCPAASAAKTAILPPLEQEKQAFEYNLFPLPNNGRMQLDYTLDEGEIGQIEVYDVTGRRKSIVQQLASGQSTRHIEAGKLPPGVYLYSIIVNGEVIATDKLIIIR